MVDNKFTLINVTPITNLNLKALCYDTSNRQHITQQKQQLQ